MTKHVELYACVYAKQFPAQALLRLRPEMCNQPCVVMEGEPPTQSVCSLNARARVLGLADGMTRVEVDTFPTIAVLFRALAEESSAKAALLECAGEFSPRVEDKCDDNAFVCLIDITGTENLFGPPEKLARVLLKRVKALGVTACVAVSSNPYTAICLARGMSMRSVAVIPSGGEGAALAPLPISVLNLSEEHTELFSMWGIHTLGLLAALPEKELIARIGQEGARLRQLARGELHHLFLPVVPALLLEERMELDTPVELLDPLLFMIGAMLEQLIIRVTTRVLALASVTVTLHLEGGAEHTRTVRPALPTNDRLLWIKLLHLDLQAHPPPAAILSLVLTAEPGSTSKVQLGLFFPQLPEPMLLDVTLARIRAIVGEGNAGSAVLLDKHKPDSFRVESFAITSTPVSTPTTTPVTNHFPKQTRAAVRKLRPAEATTVTLRDKVPVSFMFRDKRYAVENAYGPWLASGEWWNPTLWDLEQWDLVARTEDGTLLCCCLIHDPALAGWRVAALYD